MFTNFQRNTVAMVLVVLGMTTTALARPDSETAMPKPDRTTASVVTIEEFSDFQCPYCARGADTMKEVLKDYPGKVKLVFRNMPLPFHPHALVAAKAFTAVRLQSPKLGCAFRDELFANQHELAEQGESYLYALASQLGVDVSKMKTDMAGDQVAKSLAEDQQLANTHGFNGTPSFMIGTVAITGARPYSEFKKIIDQQLGQ